MTVERVRIPVASPDLSGNEERYVVDAIRSSWISSNGPYLERFEAEFASLVGARVALGVANGTVALHLALETLGVGPGDEVIVPSLTYVATANACRYVGAEPVFVDVDPESWCLDPLLVEAAISERTKAIIAVHLYGHPADIDALVDIGRRHDVRVIEDAAEAHGALYRGRPVGALGDVGTFSFYGNKMITSGEGGAVTLNDPQLAARARQLRGQGVDPTRRYWFPIVGHNFRMTNLAAALLCAQIERFDAIKAARRAIFESYRRELDDLPGLGFQPVAPWADPAHWMFCITVDPDAFGISRDELMRSLEARDIETRPFFIPVHRLPPYIRPSISDDRLRVTMKLANTGMNLPTSGRLSTVDLRRVVDGIRKARPVVPR